MSLLHKSFTVIGKKEGEDFAKFCGLLRIYEVVIKRKKICA